MDATALFESNSYKSQKCLKPTLQLEYGSEIASGNCDMREPEFELNYPGLTFKDFPRISGLGSTREASL